MMKIIVNSMPEIDFVVDEKENISPVILEEGNVRKVKITKRYPKLLVTGCGFMINSKASLFTELIYFLKGKHIADYCMGCNIEPLDTPLKRWLIKKKLNKFKLIVCRDKKSFSWLCKNVTKPHKEYLPDILFAMPEKWLAEKRDGGKLGISLMHRAGDTKECSYYKEMATFADFWTQKTGKGVILMAFDSGEENDVYSCECVKNLMKSPEKAEIVIHKRGGEILKAYSECSKIIGARFHSAVLSLKMGLPFFPIIYREKMKNLIDDTFYPVKGCPIDEIDSERVKDFLTGDVSYKSDESFISDSLKYNRIFKKALDKD